MNFNYKTVNSQWTNNLMATYASGNNPNSIYYNEYKQEINQYINKAKKQHLVIQGDYFVEPTITYTTLGNYMRVWTKFKINSDTAKKATLFEAFQLMNLLLMFGMKAILIFN